MIKHYLLKSQLTIEEDLENKKGFICGYASVYGTIDCYDDVIEKGAYDKVVNGPLPKMFFNHQTDGLPIGDWLSMSADDYGLYVKGELDLECEESRRIYNAMKKNRVDGLSVSILVDDGVWDEETDTFRIKSISELREISICTFPANPDARAVLIKSKMEGCTTIKDCERLLRDVANFSKNDAKAFISLLKKAIKQNECDAHLSDDCERLIKLLRGN